jgi:hypothetical protein
VLPVFVSSRRQPAASTALRPEAANA